MKSLLINKALTFDKALALYLLSIGERVKLYFIILNLPTMLYLIAVILIIGWLLGFFVFSAGGLIHVLLVVAIIAILLRLIRGDRAL
ncbi:MAG: lmo0937 family membrane protein [Chitinophagaceae bacterium]